jgi:hypothetical protein
MLHPPARSTSTTAAPIRWRFAPARCATSWVPAGAPSGMPIKEEMVRLFAGSRESQGVAVSVLTLEGCTISSIGQLLGLNVFGAEGNLVLWWVNAEMVASGLPSGTPGLSGA